MKVSQLNYGAIKNAYASQFGARQAEISISEQKAQKKYTEKAVMLEGIQMGLDVLSIGLNGMGKAYQLGVEADTAEASTALTAKVPELTAYLETAEANGGVWDIDEDGHATMKPEVAEGLRNIVESGINPRWAGSVQDQYKAGAVKLMSAWSEDSIRADIQSKEASRAENGLILVNEGAKADIASDDGYANVDSAINAMTWLNEYDRENLRIEKHQAVDTGRWNRIVSEHAVSGDYSGGKAYIDGLVKSGEITVGSEEYNTLINALNNQYSVAKSNVATEAQNYATEALAGGTSPATVRKTIEAETEARGYSAEFRESAMDGVDIAQASYAYSAIQDDLTSLLNGYSTINDLQTFKQNLKDGEYAYLFEGIEGEADKLISDFIDPAIKDLREFMDEIDKSMEDNFKKEADAILAGNYKPSDKVYLISSYAGQNPTLQVLARGYIDKINDNLLTDSQQIIYDNWDKLAETRIKDAAGDAWGKEGGMPYMQKLVDFRTNMQKFIQSHPDDLTDDMLNDYAVQQLGLLLSSNIDSINEAARLGSGEGTLVEAGARTLANPIEGDFSYNTNKLGQAIDAVLSPEMRNEMILNPDTGAWENTSDAGENLWNEMWAIEMSMLNNDPPIAVTMPSPMIDDEGNIYTYPVTEDKDGNKYAISKEGLLRQTPESAEWELFRPFNPAKTADRQEERPEILLRHTKGDGNQFWHEGTWYTVSKLDPDSDVGQAYGRYRQTYKGIIPNAEER